MWRVALILMVCLRVGAATYYVAKTGNDGNPGTSISPWLTISHAASIANAGDLVIVKSGEYDEVVSFPNNGSVGNPITFSGERDGSGNWLTVIDPSKVLTNGWVAATEIGTGVWKQPSLAYQTLGLTITNQIVAFVYSMGDISAYSSQAYTNTVALGLTSGSNFLKLSTNVTLYTTQSHSAIKSWDGVEAMWGTSSNDNLGTWSLYLRLRDGRSPNGLNIRAVSGSSTLFLNNRSFVTVSNFDIKCSLLGAYLNDASCHDLVLASNHMSGGNTALSLQVGVHNNVIQNNDITGDYYGYSDPGAWDNGGSPDSAHVIRENLYLVSKFIMGQSTTYYLGIQFFENGNSNVIAGNRIYKSIGTAINLRSDYPAFPYASNTLIYSNSIEAQTSEGIAPSMGQVDCRIFGNALSDCNLNLRFHFLEQPGDSNRLVYVYRNTSWLPGNYGDHIFTWSGASGVSNENATVWLYWNSFSGGQGVIRDNGQAQLNGGLPGFRYLNNITSGTLYVNPNSWGTWMWTNPAALGLFDYNLVAPITPVFISPNPEAAWWKSHNITNAVAVWATAKGTSFALPSGSSAIDAALDVTVPFTDGASYPALPNTPISKTGPAWDMGAFEYQNPQTNSVARITNFHVKKTKVGP